MEIRKAERKDSDEILGLYSQSDFLKGYDEISSSYCKEDIDDYIDRDGMFVAECENKIVGAMFIEIYTTYLYLHTLIVDSKNQRKGVGKVLLDFILKTAKDKKLLTIEMMVDEKNSVMIKILKKLGYIEGKKFVFFAKELSV